MFHVTKTSRVVFLHSYPYKHSRLELKAFKKVSLDKGEDFYVKFSLGKEAFSYWDDKCDSWKVEPGEYKIQIGSSSAHIKLSSPFRIM